MVTNKRKPYVAPSLVSPGEYAVWLPLPDVTGKWVARETFSNPSLFVAIARAFLTESYADRERREVEEFQRAAHIIHSLPIKP